MQDSHTCSYYDSYAKQFFDHTVSVNFAETQNLFLSKLTQGATILDFGCGSGRDTKYFLSQGYCVEAIDGSLELCKLATQYTGIPVRHMFFQELAEINRYDGIWACASILHLPLNELNDVIHKMKTALKNDGVIYTAFKYGVFLGERNGRFFTDMTEELFADFMQSIDGLKIEEQWITFDARPGRGEERWLNIILRKQDMH